MKRKCHLCLESVYSKDLKWFNDINPVYICIVGAEIGGNETLTITNTRSTYFAVCKKHYYEAVTNISKHLGVTFKNISKYRGSDEKWSFMSKLFANYKILSDSCEMRKLILQFLRPGLRKMALEKKSPIPSSSGTSSVENNREEHDTIDSKPNIKQEKNNSYLNRGGAGVSAFGSLYNNLLECLVGDRLHLFKAAYFITKEMNTAKKDLEIKKFVNNSVYDFSKVKFCKYYDFLAKLTDSEAFRVRFATYDLQSDIIMRRIRNNNNPVLNGTTSPAEHKKQLMTPDVRRADQYLKKKFTTSPPFKISMDILKDWVCPKQEIEYQLRSFLYYLLGKITVPRMQIENFSNFCLPPDVIEILFEISLIVFGFNQPELNEDINPAILSNSKFFAALSPHGYERKLMLAEIKAMKRNWINEEINKQLNLALSDIARLPLLNEEDYPMDKKELMKTMGKTRKNSK